MGHIGIRLAFAVIVSGLALAFGLGGWDGALAADEASVAVGRRGASPGLLGAWELVTLQAAVGQVEGTAGAGLTIVFGADGRAVGAGGCNTFGAAYTSDAGGGPGCAPTSAGSTSTCSSRSA